MKVIMRYDPDCQPPLLTMHIHGSPHKRQHREVLQNFREELLWTAKRSISNEVDLPINHEIDLNLFLTNPNSPDLDHLLEAVFQALDGKSLKGPSIMKDDRMIQKVTISKYYPNEATKRDGAR